MARYDDPRFLQTVIEKLQRDVATLKKDTLPLLSYQRGPTPGWQNAGQLGPGPSMKAAMHLHLDGNIVGVAPRQTVTDANGTVRAELGNLAANGTSAAQYGFRANDAGGNPIFDSLGLIAVMNQLGRGDNTGLTTYTTTTPTLIASTAVTFSLARAIRVLALLAILGNSAQQTGKVDLFVDGTDVATPASNGASALAWFGFGGPTVTSANFYSATLAAGSHTLDLRGYVTATPGTLTVTGATLIVYGLGS